MKLKHQLFLTFLMMILIPVILTGTMLAGSLILQAGEIRSKYGIDISHLQPFDRRLIATIIFLMLAMLILTALFLSAWLYTGIATPVSHLTKAVQSIRDGNLDFELKNEWKIEEMQELYAAFDEMKRNLKEANEEKIAFDRQNRELISNISHDLKTPITTVKGYVEGIMDGVADTPEKMDRYIRTIYNKTNEMDHLINELSFYSKISANRIPYAFDKIGARAFFDDAAAEIGDDLQAKGFIFTYENTVPENTLVIADTEQIERVLNNIVGNAVKYNDKEEKCVRLSVSLHADEVQVCVSDNGRGIAAKDLANIFERFYRTDASRNSSAGGSGIGLSIVKKIIEDHGGRVWAASKDGEGTSIYFALRCYGVLDQNAV